MCVRFIVEVSRRRVASEVYGIIKWLFRIGWGCCDEA